MPKRVAENDDLAEVWTEIVEAIPEEDIADVREGDKLFLEAMARHYLMSVIASDEVFLAGTTTIRDDHNGRDAKSPAEVIMRAQSAAFLSYLKEAGWTPKARKARSKVESDDNPFLS